jgi:hypothetical protein
MITLRGVMVGVAATAGLLLGSGPWLARGEDAFPLDLSKVANRGFTSDAAAGGIRTAARAAWYCEDMATRACPRRPSWP